jgi:hypothetical protein
MAASRPNIVLVMADDHAAHAIGCYGSRINQTPGIDRLAAEGMPFTSCFCTNSLCSPSRATILTGTYNHVNGVLTLSTPFDARQPGFPGLLQGGRLPDGAGGRSAGSRRATPAGHSACWSTTRRRIVPGCRTTNTPGSTRPTRSRSHRRSATTTGTGRPRPPRRACGSPTTWGWRT